jgi:hypothetical protein
LASSSHLTALDFAHVHGLVERPRRVDPVSDRLRELGYAHEQRDVDTLRRRGDVPICAGSRRGQPHDRRHARLRGRTILQLAAYSVLVGVVQGVSPEHFHVVTPDPVAPVHTFRTDDFAACEPST